MARRPGPEQRFGADDRPKCKGTNKDGSPCRYKARPDEEFCGRHSDQREARDGPKSKFDDEGIRNTILLWMQQGSYARAAAESVGVGETTLYRWLEEGEKDAKAKVESEKREFWEAFTRARAEGEVGLVADVRKLARQDGRLALEMLARRNPKQWGRRRLEVSGPDGGPIESSDVPAVDYEKLSLEERMQLLDLLDKAGPAPIAEPA
jgi:transposase-like protein